MPMTPFWSVGGLAPRLYGLCRRRRGLRISRVPHSPFELSLSRDSDGHALVYRVTGPHVFRVAVSETIGCRPAGTTHAPPVSVCGSCAAVAGMHSAPSCERVACRQEVLTSHCADMPVDGSLDDFSAGPGEDMAQRSGTISDRTRKQR